MAKKVQLILEEIRKNILTLGWIIFQEYLEYKPQREIWTWNFINVDRNLVAPERNGQSNNCSRTFSVTNGIGNFCQFGKIPRVIIIDCQATPE